MKYIFLLFLFLSIYSQTNLNPAILNQIQNLNKDQLKERYQQNRNSARGNELGLSKIDTTITIDTELLKDSIDYLNKQLNRLGRIKQEKFFGERFFKHAKIKPNTYGPVPDSYIFGTGDEIIITLWGETQLEESYTIDRENNIYAKEIGRISLGGLRYDQSKKLIKKKYEKAYSTLKGKKPLSFINVKIGKHRRVHVSVLGYVKYPRNVVLSSLNTVFDAVVMAGGPQIQASLRTVEIRRGNDVLYDDLYSYMVPSIGKKSIRLEDGDVIYVSAKKKEVDIQGGVRVPGIYELSNNSNAEEIINIAGGLKFNASLKHVSISSVESDVHKTLTFKNLAQTKNYILNDNDIIYVNEKIINDSSYVEVIGSVLFPGKYSFQENTTLKKYIDLSGGFKKGTLLKSIDILRKINGKEYKSISISSAALQTFTVEDGDIIHLYNETDFIEPRSIYIFSYAQGFFEFPYFKESNIYDYLNRIGGIRYNEDDQSVEIVRLADASEEHYAKSYSIRINSDYLNQENSNGDFKLLADDIIIIRKSPKIEEFKIVKVAGEVNSVGSFPLLGRKERVSDIIRRFGGFKNSAYIDGFQLLRKVTSNFKIKKNIQIYPENFDYADKRFVNYNQKKNESQFVRIPVDIHEIIEDSDYSDNIILMDLDSIYVPRNPHVVVVQGEVNYPNAFVYEEGASIEYYLSQAGGLTEFGDDTRIQAVLANGKQYKSGFFSSDEINAGSVITVPPRVSKDSSNETLSTILTSLSTIITALVLIKQL